MDGAPLPPDGIEAIILPRAHDVGGFEVRRALPAQERQMVGPFIFFDQMGPGEFLTGRGLDVRPHPHIGLSTVTYLFEGEILHRDSLGTVQPIRPGDVNWMTAGQGIAHSERTPDGLRAAGPRIFGIQTWVGLPRADEEMAPDFLHVPAARLPTITRSRAPSSCSSGRAAASWCAKAGAVSSWARGSATHSCSPASRAPPARSAGGVRSECTMPRPAVIQFTAPGRIGTTLPRLSRCRISPSNR